MQTTIASQHAHTAASLAPGTHAIARLPIAAGASLPLVVLVVARGNGGSIAQHFHGTVTRGATGYPVFTPDSATTQAHSFNDTPEIVVGDGDASDPAALTVDFSGGISEALEWSVVFVAGAP